jgi:hypothetical protein
MEPVRMKPFHVSMDEYKRQMKKGDVREAYKGLMEYILELRSYFKKRYPDYVVPGSIYYGYMDMTYFSFFPASFKRKKLKVAVVFIHETCRFEVWLAGYNKQVQTHYWRLLIESDWRKYHIPATTKGIDSILEHVVVEHPDFSNLDELTQQIENGTVTFIKNVEDFLSKQQR